MFYTKGEFCGGKRGKYGPNMVGGMGGLGLRQHGGAGWESEGGVWVVCRTCSLSRGGQPAGVVNTCVGEGMLSSTHSRSNQDQGKSVLNGLLSCYYICHCDKGLSTSTDINNIHTGPIAPEAELWA